MGDFLHFAIDAHLLFCRQKDQGQITLVIHVFYVPSFIGYLAPVGNGIRLQLVLKTMKKPITSKSIHNFIIFLRLRFCLKVLSIKRSQA
jgi:hypothetical protein